jgi:serine/threonine-protein kinase
VIKKPRSDPKPDVLTITAPIHLELVRVPAGEFLMGSDPAKDEDARDSEQPQHIIKLPEFYIGRCLVTNAQYAAFVQATGHSTPFYWRSNDKFPLGKEHHPVAQVSWKDAVAFCRWLSREINKVVQLPSEAEWEKAARGTDGRIYPWGDKLPTVSLCNFDDYFHDTTPVGHYSPLGDSPYGCADMAGNVWEWTRSAWRRDYFVKNSVFGYPYDPGDGRESLKIGAPRVLRGGAFHNSLSYVRCASRRSSSRSNSGNRFGFRVCVVSGKD